MAENIVIVESPTKSNTIKKILNQHQIQDLKDFDVLSTKGHILELVKNKGKYGLGIDLDNFEPIYKVMEDKLSLVNDLREVTSHAKNIFIATDPDREGEAIGKHVMDVLHLPSEKVKRIEFYEITKKGILAGISNPRNINEALVSSQEARRLVDRIVGFRLSKLLQYKIASKSAGRVQSVALKLICDQEKLIQEFIPQTYYSIIATLENNILIALKSIKNKNNDVIKLSDKKIVDEIIANLDEKFKLTNISEKVINHNPPLPLITSTILQKSPYSTKTTEMILQKLFEGVKVNDETVGLITYHRTDSTRLSADFIEECHNFINDTFGKDFIDEQNRVIKKPKINIQDAHEAIHPTYLKHTPDAIKSFLNDKEYVIYSLIYNYAVASQMAKAISKNIKYTFTNNNYDFICNSSKITFLGYKKILADVADSTKVKKTDESGYNIDYKLNDKIKLELNKVYAKRSIEVIAHETQPPARYSEAKLIQVLEKLGIGRPSTYGKIIYNISASGYINYLNKQFKPTVRGLWTNDFLQNNFSHYVSESFTADMEDKLDKITNQNINEKEFIKNFFIQFNELIEQKNEEIKPQYSFKLNKPCPKCNKGEMVLNSGKYGDFIGCSLYPECKYTAKLDSIDEISDDPGDNNLAVKTTIIDHKCPKCNSELVIRKSKKYKTEFIGCSNFPKCNYMEKKK